MGANTQVCPYQKPIIMIRNYLKIAYRNLLRNKAYSFINIGGLAVGMAVAIMIGLWMNDELTFDHYHRNHDRIAQVYQSQTFNGKIGTGPAIPRPLEMALRKDYGDNFKYLVMSSWRFRSILAHGEKKLVKQGNFMQQAVPEMLGLKMLSGTEGWFERPQFHLCWRRPRPKHSSVTRKPWAKSSSLTINIISK